ncbi:MAG: hypothetical protein KAG66_06135 [Methylococcales bacterium]|nr:hypothetical protein [Methylococcales bacterium]
MVRPAKESGINYQRILKRCLPVALIALVGLNGCAAGIAAHTMDWQEEVLLHDGRIAIAQRHYKLGGYSTLASTERSAVTQTVTLTLPGSSQHLTWQTDFRDSVPEPNSLNLLLFDVVNGIPYIATYPAGCIAYNKWQRPNPPYVLFKHAQGQWQRISMAEFPGQLIKTNVIVGRPAAELLKSYYTVEGVEARNYYLEPQYKRILREAISKDRLEQMCEERVLYKGYWILPNDPVARNMIDQREKQGKQQ